MKILIVDDSDLIRSNLIKLFRFADDSFEIHEAEDTGKAINTLIEINPEVIIIDLRLPGGNGYEVLSAAKEAQIPLKIVLTNYFYEMHESRSYDLGADHFFDKSDEYTKLLDIIREFRDKRKAGSND